MKKLILVIAMSFCLLGLYPNFATATGSYVDDGDDPCAMTGIDDPAICAQKNKNEEAEMMKDPVYTFLGWQANKEDEAEAGHRRLFNASLIKEAVAFMTQMLAAVRMAKQNSQSVDEAIKNTNALALANAPTPQPKTNDPMLQAQEAPQVDAQRVVNANVDPKAGFAPAAHVDPISGSFVSGNSNTGNGGFGGGFTAPQPQQPANAPFQAPNFGGFGSAPQSDLPF